MCDIKNEIYGLLEKDAHSSWNSTFKSNLTLHSFLLFMALSCLCEARREDQMYMQCTSVITW
jgi:hypothetical protein